MAQKRMFSRDITSSDAFLDMPSSSQSLYFHLGMEADDDGFIGNPKKVMRVIGVGEDDFKILLAKKFLLDFPSGVVVVKHHRINNNWDKYNCKRTMYREEFSQLNIKENKAYTLDKSQGVPLQSENSLKTVFRIEENRRDKNTSETEDGIRVVSVSSFDGEEKAARKPAKYPHRVEVSHWFPEPEPSWLLNTTECKHMELLYLRGEQAVRGIIKFCQKHSDEDFFPSWERPSDLERNWNKIIKFADRNGL